MVVAVQNDISRKVATTLYEVLTSFYNVVASCTSVYNLVWL